MDKDQEIRLQLQRKKAWLEGMELQKVQRQLKKEEQTPKIPSQVKIDKLQKQVSNEIESNVCSICLELMIPPIRQPIILFPCGHNFCKDCLLQEGNYREGKINSKMKIKNCSLCRAPIASYALNRALMTLICTYSNNKDLLEKQNQEQSQSREQVTIRCTILDREKIKIHSEIEEITKEADILEIVLRKLRVEKRRNQQELDKLNEEKSLIEKTLRQKNQEFASTQSRLSEAKKKIQLIQSTLGPLLREKEKLEMLQIMKLVNNPN